MDNYSPRHGYTPRQHSLRTKPGVTSSRSPPPRAAGCSTCTSPSPTRRRSTSNGQTGGATVRPPPASPTTPAGPEITSRCCSTSHPRFKATATANVPISVIDIDAALDNRYIYAAGSRQAVRADRRTTPRLPNQFPGSPALPRHYRVRVSECKGTVVLIRVRQLASAVEQLGGIRVAGRIPAGLAVSTITAHNGVSYLALDPEDVDEAYEVNSNTIERTASFRLSDSDRRRFPCRAHQRCSPRILGDTR